MPMQPQPQPPAGNEGAATADGVCAAACGGGSVGEGEAGPVPCVGAGTCAAIYSQAGDAQVGPKPSGAGGSLDCRFSAEVAVMAMEEENGQDPCGSLPVSSSDWTDPCPVPEAVCGAQTEGRPQF